MNALYDLTRRLERAETLDFRKATHRRSGPNSSAGCGTEPAQRHLPRPPLHPMLTDLPIGAWSMSALLDTVGGRSAERSADLLMAAGVLAAVPTAASGLNDWSDTYGPDTRVGLVHATINTAALSLYVASLSSRAHGERTRGKIMGWPDLRCC